MNKKKSSGRKGGKTHKEHFDKKHYPNTEKRGIMEGKKRLSTSMTKNIASEKVSEKKGLGQVRSCASEKNSGKGKRPRAIPKSMAGGDKLTSTQQP